MFTPYYRLKYFSSYRIRKRLCIFDSEETICYIVKNQCSVSRFGDGEFQMITHYLQHGKIEDFHVDTFQSYSPLLAKKLIEVFESNLEGLLLCIPYAFKKSSVYRGYNRIFFEREWLLRKNFICSRIRNKQIQFGDACFTRFWMKRTDILDYSAYVALLKQIWDKRDVIFLEGEQSRLGVGNDLFENATSIQRLLFPSINAFQRYEDILKVVQELPKNRLYLIALGHTATVLAYEMSKRGYWAIDIGHIDIEYEWMRMKAKNKVAVPNKYVNEVVDGRIMTELNDMKYQSQIIGRIS